MEKENFFGKKKKKKKKKKIMYLKTLFKRVVFFTV